MFHLLIDAAIAAGAAYFADAVVKDKTGKHIHEHIYDWWCEIRDYISAWLTQNKHLVINRVALIVLDAFDQFAVRTKQMADMITIGISGINRMDQDFDICTQEVSIAEVLEMFPQLRDNPVLIEEISN